MFQLDFMKTLIIAPHPDDEVFGCGGLLHRLKAAGGEVYVLYMTVGTAADFSPRGQSSAEERVAELEEVVRFLDLDGHAIAFPGNDFHLRLDAVPQKDLVHAIERGTNVSLQELRPDLVLTTSTADYNQDHRAVGEATLSALRPGSPKYKSFQPLVLTYELPYHQWNLTPSLPSPSLYVRLDADAMQAKRSALELYQSQLKAPDSPLSIRGVEVLASYRGLSCGAPAAEAYQIKRLVV